VRKDLLLKLSLRADRLRVLALLADSEELAGDLDAYLHLPTKFEYFDGLMLDPVFDPDRDHPAIVALRILTQRRRTVSLVSEIARRPLAARASCAGGRVC
jgi:hypothetical protein